MMSYLLLKSSDRAAVVLLLRTNTHVVKCAVIRYPAYLVYRSHHSHVGQRQRSLAVTSSVKELPRALADDGDMFRHWTEQLDEPSQMVLVPAVTLS